MGLFTKGKPGVDFSGWQNLPEPRFAYKSGKDSAYLFFIDDHEDHDKILTQRLYAVDNSKHMIRVMIEKEVYDTTPEYYSEESLFAQLRFYQGISGKVLRQLLVGALGIGAACMVLLPLLIPSMTSTSASMAALGFALIYMFYYMNVIFKKTLDKARVAYRAELIELMTEKRLDEIFEIQDAYIARRKAELKEEREGVVLPDDVPPFEEENAKEVEDNNETENVVSEEQTEVSEDGSKEE